MQLENVVVSIFFLKLSNLNLCPIIPTNKFYDRNKNHIWLTKTNTSSVQTFELGSFIHSVNINTYLNKYYKKIEISPNIYE
jgi:hypothetical protein